MYIRVYHGSPLERRNMNTTLYTTFLNGLPTAIISAYSHRVTKERQESIYVFVSYLSVSFTRTTPGAAYNKVHGIPVTVLFHRVYRCPIENRQRGWTSFFGKVNYDRRKIHIISRRNLKLG